MHLNCNVWDNNVFIKESTQLSGFHYASIYFWESILFTPT
jgi:hypothetical protein